MNPRTLFVLGAIVGAAIVVSWLIAHNRCATCKERGQRLMNKLGSWMIEPKPEGA